MAQFSNSKLTKAQKSELKDMKVQHTTDGGALYQHEGFTMAVMPVFPGSKMSLISVSFASELELKIRPKVGAYMALSKMFKGEFVQVPAEAVPALVDALITY
jgi:hypothetical protein